MNKINLILLMIALLLSLTGCSGKEKDNNNYTASRTGQNTSSENNNDNIKNEENVEEDLSSFSTKIYTPNDESRQKNISITCQSLNGTIVNPGETFSFCNTVRKSNSR